MQRYGLNMSQIQEQMMFEEYIDGVLQLDDEQFNEYYDSLDEDQQQELEEVIGKIAKGIGKVAVAPITLPFKAVKGVAKGVGKLAKGAAKAVTSKPAKAAGSAVAKGAGMAAKGAASGIKKVANRLSVSGRADAAKKKADAIAKRTAERERLKKEKDRVDQERQKARDAMKKDIEKEKSEALDDKDKDTVKDIIKGLKKASGLHGKQAKQLQKDIDDEINDAGIDRLKRDKKAAQLKKDIKAIGEEVEDLDLEDVVEQLIKAKTPQEKIKTLVKMDKLKSKASRVMNDKDKAKKMANDLNNLAEFTSKQIDRLKKEYEDLRGKETGINPEKFAKLRKLMDRFSKSQLLQLVKADIPILTSGAKSKLVIKYGMKWKQLPEDFIPYIDVFAEDERELSEAKKGKFKEVDPKVVDRIEKMMNGTRAEKDSIANMLNYFMPPEVVDMVRYKLKIVPKRGKIKFR